MCTYACSDFEPLKPARKTKKPQPVQLTEVGSRIHPKPTLKHRIRVYRQALNCYNDTVGLFFNDDRILAAYLVESSPDHYHAGIIFTRPLPRREHDEILAQINHADLYLPDLDKDSRRAKEGFGDAFRAPHLETRLPSQNHPVVLQRHRSPRKNRGVAETTGTRPETPPQIDV